MGTGSSRNFPEEQGRVSVSESVLANGAAVNSWLEKIKVRYS
jgi:hypothetical protein